VKRRQDGIVERIVRKGWGQGSHAAKWITNRAPRARPIADDEGNSRLGLALMLTTIYELAGIGFY
jgi:hypothetical protein